MPIVARDYEGPACPRCGARLTADWIQSGTVICPDCRKPFEATAFHPPQRQIEIVSVAAALTPEGANACANHAHNAAVTSCGRCGLFICALCNMDVGTGPHCPACFDHLRAENTFQPTAMRFRDYGAMARVAMIVGLLSFVYIGIPFAVLALYYARKGFRQLRAEGEPTTGLVLIIVFTAVELLGGLIMIIIGVVGISGVEVMTPAPRVKLGRSGGAMRRAHIFETADAIEIDLREGYEVTRKRVLYEEVLLVTFHRSVGWWYVASLGLVTLLFGTITLATINEPVAPIVFGAITTPFLAASVIRLVMKVDYVTVFGRRSRAVIRFALQKQRAREVYGRICSRTLAVHRSMVPPEESVPSAGSDQAPVPSPPEG